MQRGRLVPVGYGRGQRPLRGALNPNLHPWSQNRYTEQLELERETQYNNLSPRCRPERFTTFRPECDNTLRLARVAARNRIFYRLRKSRRELQLATKSLSVQMNSDSKPVVKITARVTSPRDGSSKTLTALSEASRPESSISSAEEKTASEADLPTKTPHSSAEGKAVFDGDIPTESLDSLTNSQQGDNVLSQ